MAEPSPPAPGQNPAGTGAAPTQQPTYKAPTPNPALKMMGISIPKKLPSRNWMIFWTITGGLSAAIIYDKREKKRATAKWAQVVAPLASELISAPSQMPRRLTIYLESPPYDGLRVAQDHFTEYVKPVLAASGLDWEFVQGRKQGDVRAAVAERVRRKRAPKGPDAPDRTDEEIVSDVRRRNNIPEWDGMAGDIVVGRHTWKEYVRGLHEGWLGPLTAPPPPPPVVIEDITSTETGTTTTTTADGQPTDGEEAAATTTTTTTEKKPEEEPKKPEASSGRPPQPLPFNTPSDYATSPLPSNIPSEFNPATPLPHPHLLGFFHTPTRFWRFLNRRKLADAIGREVAAVCLAASHRPFHQGEQDEVLKSAEKEWSKYVWTPAEQEAEEEAKEVLSSDEKNTRGAEEARQEVLRKERIWAGDMVLDPRVAERMRRFEVTPEWEAKARETKVPEEKVEGWLKGSLRGLWRWAVSEKQPLPRSSDIWE